MWYAGKKKRNSPRGKEASDLPKEPLSNIIYFTCDMLEQSEHWIQANNSGGRYNLLYLFGEQYIKCFLLRLLYRNEYISLLSWCWLGAFARGDNI